MYEDIEILRRILDRKLTSLYPSVPSKAVRADAFGSGTLSFPATADAFGSGTLSFPPVDAATGTMYYTVENPKLIEGQKSSYQELYGIYNRYPASIPFRSLEGIYLKGQGVIYTATLASLQPPAKAEADGPARWKVDVVQLDSEWDSIRRQVRNEKEKPKKPEESKPPSLSDVLLKVLAENGHHFSQLGENESLTIVVTVHETSPSSPAAKSGTGSTKAESNPAPAGSDADTGREARNLEMLGELHLKQAKYQEAIMVFQRWLERTESPKQKAELRRKLAQCYLGLGEDEKARAELERAIALTKKATEAREKPAPDAKPPAALPVKLIISAPKKLLDQAKEGKISFEDFRRQASVETLRFGDRR
jgi:tetratricopeptide (TPR) repeat protein